MLIKLKKHMLEQLILKFQFIIKFPNKIEIERPEIEFDDNRIDAVQGRTISLFNSIITIKCTGGLGEFHAT